MKSKIMMTALMTLAASAAFAVGNSSTQVTQKTTDSQVTARQPLQSKTAMDQGMNPQDTNLTRTIREKIVADNTLSMRAKNITIISQNGLVTLKGPVANNQEQTKVEEIAKKVSGTTAVTNQTEVSTNY